MSEPPQELRVAAQSLFCTYFQLVHIFKLVRTIIPRNFSSTRKIHPSARGDSEETFFNKKNEPQCKRGVVKDIVKYNCVSDNFILTCLLLLLLEDVIKVVRISSCDSLLSDH